MHLMRNACISQRSSHIELLTKISSIESQQEICSSHIGTGDIHVCQDKQTETGWRSLTFVIIANCSSYLNLAVKINNFMVCPSELAALASLIDMCELFT